MTFVLSTPRDRVAGMGRDRQYGLVSTAPRMPGAAERIEVGAGDRIGIVMPGPITRYVLPAVLTTLLEDGAGRALREARFVMDPAEAPADDGDANWLVFDGRALARLDEAERGRRLESLADRVVLVVHDVAAPQVGAAGETAVAVMTAGAIHGLGDLAWYRDAAPTLKGLSADSAVGDDDLVLFDEDDDE